eukprot:tig00001254_g7813.t1
MNPLVRKGRTGQLTEDDLSLPKGMTSGVCSSRFEAEWAAEKAAAEKEGREPNLRGTLQRVFAREFFKAGVWKAIWGILIILAAFFFVRELLLWAEGYNNDKKAGRMPGASKGWILAIFFFLDCWFLSMAMQQMTARSAALGVKVRAALLSAVFRKSMKLEDVTVSTGDVVSLAAVDCQKLQEACTTLHYLWSGPVEAVAICILLATQLKISVLPGVGILLVVVPTQFFIGKKTAYLRKKTVAFTDLRVQMMNEILMAIKVVKFYCWEKQFEKKVQEYRSQEMDLAWKAAILKSVSLMIVFIIPPAMAITMFSMLTDPVNVGVPDAMILNASIAFTTLSLFNTLRFPLVVLPKALKNFTESLSAVQRLQAYLLRPETKGSSRLAAPTCFMRNCDVAYVVDGKLTPPVLHDVSFELPAGKLLTVTGVVGSGKTSAFAALLGLASVTRGECALGGRVAYVPQWAWIQNLSVRDNILFGRPFDPVKYARVVHACALEADFRMMANGDLTELGERGANLSGGQRQRISLARAVYSDADVFFLDAPLSAVDQHTANHIFQYCIRGLLAGKTILMSTHKVHLLAQSDLCGVFSHGRLVYYGAYNRELIKPHVTDLLVGAADDLPPQQLPLPVQTRSSFDFDDDGTAALARAKLAPAPAKGKKAKAAPKMIVEDESMKKTGFESYRVWARRAGTTLALISIAIHVFAQCVRIGNDYWLNVWTGAQVPGRPILVKADNSFYAFVQFGFVVGFGIWLMIRGLSFYRIARRASLALHNNTFGRVLRAPFAFFVVTPLGRVLNCFAGALDQVDESLPDVFHITLVYFCILLTTVSLSSAVLPLFAIVTAGLFAAFFLYLRLYLGAGRALKRLSGATNGKVLSHLNEAILGLPVIRAFGEEGRFTAESAALVDGNHRCVFNQDAASIWLAFRLDFVGALIILGNALLCVGMRDDYPPRTLGLTISNSLQALVFFTWVVRGYADIDSQVSSVTAIEYYGSEAVGQEPEAGPDAPKVEASWPARGEIKFDKVVLHYLPHQPAALKGVTLTIQAGEKVGVVGRTGSGKSTLIIALFRLVEAKSGSIFIDGVDTGRMPLEELRSRIAIIPQEPIMFRGTVRSNLDPFGAYSDAEIWEALRTSHLKEYVEALPGKLEAEVAEGGSNWSLGMRQLCCLCRVVLKRSSILVLDEATASVDPKTESLFVSTIETVFQGATIIQIAHRLDTIVSSDKILFMDAGLPIEFDAPAALLDNPASHFARLVEETGLGAAALRDAIGPKREHLPRASSISMHGAAAESLRRAASISRGASLDIDRDIQFPSTPPPPRRAAAASRRAPRQVGPSRSPSVLSGLAISPSPSLYTGLAARAGGVAHSQSVPEHLARSASQHIALASAAGRAGPARSHSLHSDLAHAPAASASALSPSASVHSDLSRGTASQ